MIDKKQLAKRLASSAVLISLTIATIFWAPDWLYFFVVECFILLALNEFFALAEKKGIPIHRALGLFLGALVPFSFYFGSDTMILMVACLALFILHFHPKLRDQALISTSVTIFGIIYVSWFLSYLIELRHAPDGPFWVFYTLLLVKGGDAGAYFVGNKYGRQKLIEHISPNKSIEGAIGGFVTTVVLSLISKIYLPYAAIYHLFILGVLIGVLAQLSDLGESLLKRGAGIKDSGQVPGLGGFLDVLDSLLLTVPFAYYYVVLFRVGV
jgi:phosphatidate cytidylyltransferase